MSISKLQIADVAKARLKGVRQGIKIGNNITERKSVATCETCLFARVLMVQVTNTRTDKSLQYFRSSCMLRFSHPECFVPGTPKMVTSGSPPHVNNGSVNGYNPVYPYRANNMEVARAFFPIMNPNGSCIQWVSSGQEYDPQELIAEENSYLLVNMDVRTAFMKIKVANEPYSVTLVTQRVFPYRLASTIEKPKEHADKDPFLQKLWPFLVREARDYMKHAEKNNAWALGHRLARPNVVSVTTV